MKIKKHKKIPKQILDGIEKKTGYTRRYIGKVIHGHARNLIIEYYWQLAQEDFGQFLKETDLLKNSNKNSRD